MRQYLSPIFFFSNSNVYYVFFGQLKNACTLYLQPWYSSKKNGAIIALKWEMQLLGEDKKGGVIE